MNAYRPARVVWRLLWSMLVVLAALSCPHRALAEPVDAEDDKFDFLDHASLLKGRVVDGDGHPVAGAKISARAMAPSFEGELRRPSLRSERLQLDQELLLRRLARERVETTSDKDGAFEIERGAIGYLIHTTSTDESQAGIVRVGKDEDLVTVPIGPTATALGRIVDQSGRGVENALVHITFRVYQGGPLGFPSGEVAAQAKSDGAGVFEAPNLVLGEMYTVSASHRDDGIYLRLKSFTPDRPGIMDLGDLRGPLTEDEEQSRFFMPRGNLSDRIAIALADAKPLGLRLLLIVGDPKDPVAKSLVEWCDRRREELSDFSMLVVSTEDEAGMSELAELYGAELAKLSLPAWFVLDENGQVVATHSLREALTAGPELLQRMPQLRKYALPPPDAQELMSDALAEARRDDKRVLVIETGTYCHPCRLLSRYLRRNADILDPLFVVVHIDSHRFASGEEVMRQVRGGKGGGIPWYAILDKEGEDLGTSHAEDGRNIGYPSNHQDIETFLNLLAAAAPQLSAEQVVQLRNDLMRRP